MYSSLNSAAVFWHGSSQSLGVMFVRFSPRPMWSATVVVLCAAGLLVAVGCGKSSDRLDVDGRVTRKDGSPLVGATVMFRSSESGKYATGVTDKDGRYELGTSRPGEGIPPGDYRVTVMENRGDEDHPSPPTVAQKYSLPGRSGLTFAVEPGGERTFDIVLDPP